MASSGVDTLRLLLSVTGIVAHIRNSTRSMAAVEELENPSARAAVIVGGDPQGRGGRCDRDYPAPRDGSDPLGAERRGGDPACPHALSAPAHTLTASTRATYGDGCGGS